MEKITLTQGEVRGTWGNSPNQVRGNNPNLILTLMFRRNNPNFFLTPPYPTPTYINPNITNKMIVPFVITLILVAVVMAILISIVVYRRLYLRHLSYVQQVDVQKVELPPLGREWDYDEEHVQNDDDNILIEISV